MTYIVTGPDGTGVCFLDRETADAYAAEHGLVVVEAATDFHIATVPAPDLAPDGDVWLRHSASDASVAFCVRGVERLRLAADGIYVDGRLASSDADVARAFVAWFVGVSRG